MLAAVVTALTLLAAQPSGDGADDGPVPSIVGWYAWRTDSSSSRTSTGPCRKLSATDVARLTAPARSKSAFTCQNTHGGSGARIVLCMTADQRHVLAALATHKQCADQREDAKANAE